MSNKNQILDKCTTFGSLPLIFKKNCILRIVYIHVCDVSVTVGNTKDSDTRNAIIQIKLHLKELFLE